MHEVHDIQAEGRLIANAVPLLSICQVWLAAQLYKSMQQPIKHQFDNTSIICNLSEEFLIRSSYSINSLQ